MSSMSRSSEANPRSSFRSRPYIVVSCPMRFSSTAPEPTSSRASARTCAGGLLRNGPRIAGIVQNEQRWLHPSLMRRYAEWAGPMRNLARSSTTVRGVAPTVTNGASAPSVSRITRTMLSRWSRPTTASMPAASSSNSRPIRCDRHPVTMTLPTAPARLLSRACLTASSDSTVAGSMKPQVLITTTSARSGSPAMRKPACAMCASIFSLSTTFFGQPSATNPTVVACSCVFAMRSDRLPKKAHLSRFLNWARSKARFLLIQ